MGFYTWAIRPLTHTPTDGQDHKVFFHAAATERYRQNTITSLETQDGRIIHDHFEKAALLLENFRARMGNSINPEMQYNLDDLVVNHEGLDQISAPFTKEEIDNVVKQMLVDKALGPDGFNGMFFKKMLAHHQRGYISALQ